MGSDLPFTLGRLNCCCTNPTSCNRGGMEELCSPGVSGVTEEGRARRHTQVDTVQRFKLPKPVLCAGGLLRVELLGRAQRQDADLLWFVALAHARVVGKRLPGLVPAALVGADGAVAVRAEAPVRGGRERERDSPHDHMREDLVAM